MYKRIGERVLSARVGIAGIIMCGAHLYRYETEYGYIEQSPRKSWW